MIPRRSARRWFWLSVVVVLIVLAADVAAAFAKVGMQIPIFAGLPGSHPGEGSGTVEAIAALQQLQPTMWFPPRWLGSARLVAYVAAGLVAVRVTGRPRTAMFVLGGAWILELPASAVLFGSPAYASLTEPILALGAVALAGALWRPRARAAPEPYDDETGVLPFDVAGATGIGPVATAPDLRLVEVPGVRRGAYVRRLTR